MTSHAYPRLAASVGLIAIVVISTVLYSRLEVGPRSDLTRFIDATGTSRPTEARLAGLSYRPVGYAPGLDRDLPISALNAWSIILKRAESTRPGTAPRELAIVSIYRGRPEDAIALLSREVDGKPSAEAWNDLAAAHLALASHEQEPARILTRAIDAAHRALSLRPQMPEAEFNLALALEKIGLLQESVAAWQSVLKSEADEAWTSETTARLRAAEIRDSDQLAKLLASVRDSSSPPSDPALARRFSQDLREALEDEFFPAWSRSILGKGADADVRFEQLNRAARLLERASHDSLAVHTVTAITRLTAPQLATQAAGHLAYARGKLEFERGRYEESARAFDEAAVHLQRVHSPFRDWALVLLGLSRYHMQQFREASALSDEVVTRATRAGYLTLSARAWWLRGVVSLKVGDPERALVAYAKSIDLFAEQGERENVANVAGAAADTLRLLGALEQGWMLLSRALSRFTDVRNLRRQYVLALNASLYASLDDSPYAALYFQDAAVAIARRYDVPNFLVESLSRRSALHTRLGEHGKAENDLRQADSLLPSIDSAASRRYQTAWLNSARAELMMQLRPRDAFEPIERARAFLDGAEPAEVPRLFLMEGRAALSDGRLDAAEGLFRQGVYEFEARWARLGSENNRVSYLDEGWQLYGELATIAFTRGDSASAFQYAERARARSLSTARTDSLVDDSSLLLKLVAALPADATLVYYGAFRVTALAWVINRHGITCTRLPLASEVLARRVTAYRRLLERNQPQRELSFDLFDALVEPILSRIPLGHRVVFAPDGALSALPFAALMNRRTGRYLIEDFSIAVTPSAKEFLRASARLAQVDNGPLRALVVGDPVPGKDGLPPLPYSRIEAVEVGELYAHSKVLVGTAATLEQVRAATHYPIVHLATHAIPNAAYPEASRIVLSPSLGRDAGDLTVREIELMDFSQTQLVVLSSCRSGYGAIYRGEGVLSLARAFLRDGVPTVVASLWDVQDEASRRLITSFHRHYREVRDASIALRRAQLEMLEAESGSTGAQWTAFQVISGVTVQ